jgi:hypothetical protein
MRARRALALSTLVWCLGARPAHAGPPASLTQNGGFATSLAGWTAINDSNVNVSWSSVDSAGAAGSGSALVRNVSASQYNLSPVFTQCVPVTPGPQYVFGFDTLIPTSQPTGQVYVVVTTYSDANCTTRIAGYATFTKQAGTWTHVSYGYPVAFTGAYSAQVEMYVGKDPAGGTFSAYVDNVSLVQPLCQGDDVTQCLIDSRFRITAHWQIVGGDNGPAHGTQLTRGSSQFWFFSPDNYELMVKVLDGCALNHRYWVYAGGLTNQRVDITVSDTWTGASKTYTNPLRTPFKFVSDTGTFGGCP